MFIRDYTCLEPLQERKTKLPILWQNNWNLFCIFRQGYSPQEWVIHCFTRIAKLHLKHMLLCILKDKLIVHYIRFQALFASIAPIIYLIAKRVLSCGRFCLLGIGRPSKMWAIFQKIVIFVDFFLVWLETFITTKYSSIRNLFGHWLMSKEEGEEIAKTGVEVCGIDLVMT